MSLPLSSEIFFLLLDHYLQVNWASLCSVDVPQIQRLRPPQTTKGIIDFAILKTPAKKLSNVQSNSVPLVFKAFNLRLACTDGFTVILIISIFKSSIIWFMFEIPSLVGKCADKFTQRTLQLNFLESVCA